MTYHGAVLLLAGYQADEERIIKQYGIIVDKLVAHALHGFTSTDILTAVW